MPKNHLRNQGGQGRREEVDPKPDDKGISPEHEAAEGQQQTEKKTRGYGSGEGEHHGGTPRQNQNRGEGAGGDAPFQGDIEDTGPFGEKTPEGDDQQGSHILQNRLNHGVFLPCGDDGESVSGRRYAR
jgi:uncharacterized protein YjcR